MATTLTYNSALNDENVYRARTAGTLRDSAIRYRLIDLFAGAGGMTLGFTQSLGHHFEPVWANDFDAYACNTYNLNFGDHCVLGDISDLLYSEEVSIPYADVVIGGPPCQGFSLLNRNREGDGRRELWRPFLDVVKRSGARVFVMENVPQLLGTPEHKHILKVAAKMGFNTTSGKLCAADYGAPQTRWRAFIVGARSVDPVLAFPPKRTHCPYDTKGNNLGLFDPTHFISGPYAWRTVRDAIGDLPEPVGTSIRDEPPPLDLHFGRNPTEMSRQRYRAIPEQGMNRFDLHRNAPELMPQCWIRKTKGGTDLFGRMWWDRPSFTIRTEFYKPEKGRYLHPEQHRPITHREAARLQSFPDSFVFTGSKIEIAKQIGNAVPPMLAARVADVVYSLLGMAVEGKVSLR